MLTLFIRWRDSNIWIFWFYNERFKVLGNCSPPIFIHKFISTKKRKIHLPICFPYQTEQEDIANSSFSHLRIISDWLWNVYFIVIGSFISNIVFWYTKTLWENNDFIDIILYLAVLKWFMINIWLRKSFYYMIFYNFL